MKSFFKNAALLSVLSVIGSGMAEAAVVRATGLVKGKSTSEFIWTVPAAKTYKLSAFVLGNATAAKARYRVYPKGRPAAETATSTCSTTATYPCFEILVNQSLNKNKWVALKTAAGKDSWTFTSAGIITVWSGNLVDTVKLGVAGLQFTNTATTKAVSSKPTGLAQGGKDSSFNWTTPAAKTFNALVYIPKTATATKVRYRVYPNGKNPSNNVCSATDASYPCYESFVNQYANRNKWVSLKMGDKYSRLFKASGFINAWAGSATTTTKVAIAGLDFRVPLVMGQSYQGGLIFRLDATQQHGLISAPTDQNIAQVWDPNNSHVFTGATLTGLAGGQSNTTKIVETLGRVNPYAARTCDELELNGYKDWYLPSKDQLHLMYTNLALKSKGNFSAARYWSSSEYGTLGTSVWAESFGPDDPESPRVGPYSKNFTFSVRAIRSF